VRRFRGRDACGRRESAAGETAGSVLLMGAVAPSTPGSTGLR
jgi:hypothetical protein